MRLRIAIDFSSFDRLGLAYGLYRYGVDLVRGLATVRPPAAFHLIGSRPEPPEEVADVLAEPGGRWEYHHLPRRLPSRGAYFLDQVPAAALAYRVRPDLIHGLDYFTPFAAPSRLVVTVFDLFDEVLSPRGGHRRPLFLECLRVLARHRVSRFVAISETTARDFRRRWGVPPNRVTTVPLGTSLPEGPAGVPARPDGPPVLLARYSLGRQKNFPTFFRAVARLRDRFPGLRLVLFGGGGVSREQAAEADRLVAQLDLGRTIDQRGFVPDAELDRLYRRATAFVLPSLYEGFGLTLLEAMARGTCVVAHHAGAPAEVVGTAGHLVDVRTPDRLAAGLADLLDKPDRVRALAAAGARRAREFTRERMAEATFAVYTGCLTR